MNIRDLICGEKFDTPAGTFEALIQVFTGFFFGVGLQFDNVKALFLQAQRLQLSDQRRLTKKEHMRAALRRTSGQLHQRFQRGFVELLGVIHQQIDLLPGQCQLNHLSQDRANLCMSDIQGLRYLAQYAGRITGATGRHHHALHRLFVGTGHQRLTQQSLAAAVRTGYHQQQLAVASQVMQLPQYRLALGREEFEARYPWSERVVTQLEMAEESLVGMQTSHRDLINL
ncbi:hypothetical protein PS645_01201 [Pseudomonas fluorescens]|uniref:Uncharacterized protein n=1 Tax=Pseudomonas fluorescens TaxID=294 RepID=A0A5E6QTV8_PSEFL|nr:hypothetical protein PS645_01201 [Pseudomonas fluorescens]